MRHLCLSVLSGLLFALPCLGGWSFDGQSRAPEAAPGGGGAVPVAMDDGSFPVLRLEMGGPWTDFELRASTNSFDSEAGLVYYIKSSGPTACPDDTNVWIYFQDDYATNPLVWKKSVYGRSIFSQLADRTNSELSYVVVCPSHECVVDWRTWMAKTNNALVWSYVRYDGISLQTNATGTKLHHNLTVPVEWRRERLAP